MDGWMDGWMDAWMDAWMDGWMDGCCAGGWAVWYDWVGEGWMGYGGDI